MSDLDAAESENPSGVSSPPLVVETVAEEGSAGAAEATTSETIAQTMFPSDHVTQGVAIRLGINENGSPHFVVQHPDGTVVEPTPINRVVSVQNVQPGVHSPVPGNETAQLNRVQDSNVNQVSGNNLPMGRRQIRIQRPPRAPRVAQRAANVEMRGPVGTQRIRITPNARQHVQINGNNNNQRIGIRVGLNGAVAINGTNGQQHNRFQLPPLAAQPLPNQNLRQASASNALENNDRYKCPICFEFLRLPTTCGECSSRFCHQCISRVISSSPHPHCPTCRREIDSDQIGRDMELQQEMHHMACRVKCHFEGCDESFPPVQLAEHEANCGFCKMRCKFATMGCRWTGLRKDLPRHEGEDCPYSRVSDFVEQFRTSRAEQQHQMMHLQQRYVASAATMDAHMRLIRHHNPRPNNPLDIFSYIYTAVCTPVTLLSTLDKWQHFHSHEGGGLMGNFLMLLPMTIFVLKAAAAGYRKVLSFEFSEDYGDALLSLCIFIFGGKCALTFAIDRSSSVWWTKCPLQLFTFSIGQRDMELLSILCLWELCIMLVYFEGSGFRAAFMFYLVFGCTFLFVPMVLSLKVASANQRFTLPMLNKSCKAVSVLILGVPSGVVAGYLGVLPSIDALVVIDAAQERYKSFDPFGLHSNEASLVWKPTLQAFYLGIRISTFISDLMANKVYAETGLAIMSLALLNTLIYYLVRLGLLLGREIMVAAKNQFQPFVTSNGLDISPLGFCLAFLWVLMLGGIALA